MVAHTLILTRHAKADPSAPSGSDADRTLSDRGRRDAAAAGEWLADLGLVPGLAVVSPAVRTRETWSAVASALVAGSGLAGPPPAVLDPRLYRNTLEDLFAVVTAIPETVRVLAVVGHNPGVAEFAQVLDDRLGDEAAREKLASGFGTAGVAVFGIDRTWAEVSPGDGRLAVFELPRG